MDLQALIGPDYKLQWEIGQGGMSTVWLADDLRAGREVAVKVLRPEFSDNQEFLSRFRNEAHTAERINHPNVVATYDYRELVDDHGRNFCFIVMEYVRGESLADLIAREGKLPEERALNLLEQAAHGLATIHAMKLVHRDIKPGNILVTPEDRVKITDFGIAKAAAAVPLTRTGMVVGTAQYVSPEQAQGKEVTSASDVYSLGVVGYEILTGKRPFTGDSSVSVAISHIKDAVPPMDLSVSAPARELINIALRKEAGRRYAGGKEFASAISQVRLGQQPTDPSPQAPQQPHYAPATADTTVMPVGTPAQVLEQAAPKKKSPVVGWLLGIAGVCALGAGALMFLSQQQDEPEPTPTPAPVTVTSVAPAAPSRPSTSVQEAPTTSSKAPKTTTQTPRTTTQRPAPTTIYDSPEETVPSEPPTSVAPTSRPAFTPAPTIELPSLNDLITNRPIN